MCDSLIHKEDEHEVVLIDTTGEIEFLNPRPIKRRNAAPEVGTVPTFFWIDWRSKLTAMSN
jgi:hypothetical protein